MLEAHLVRDLVLQLIEVLYHVIETRILHVRPLVALAAERNTRCALGEPQVNIEAEAQFIFILLIEGVIFIHELLFLANLTFEFVVAYCQVQFTEGLDEPIEQECACRRHDFQHAADSAELQKN